MKKTDNSEQESENKLTQASINKAIEALVSEHGKFLKNFIAKRTWNEQDIEDIYQSTLVEAIKSFPKFRNESQPRTWLCGIAYNVIRNYARKLNLISCDSLDILESVDIEAMESAGGEDPANIYDRESFLEKLQDVSSGLPAAVRQTFFMVTDSGKNYEQTAQLLGVPIGTVRSRVSRAREVLRGKCSL